MDKQVLLDNLETNILNKSLFNSGLGVVYFLITARKIIDNERLVPSYPTLYVYGNWIAHCELGYEPSTKKIMPLPLSPDLTIGKSRKEILNQIKKHLEDIFNFEKLKTDIKKFIKDKEIPIDPSLNWNSFRKHFLKEVNTSKIEFKTNGVKSHLLKKSDRVTF